MAEEKQTQRRSGPLPKLPIDRLIAVLASMDDETLASAETVVKAYTAGRGVKRNGRAQEQAMLELGAAAAEE